MGGCELTYVMQLRRSLYHNTPAKANESRRGRSRLLSSKVAREVLPLYLSVRGWGNLEWGLNLVRGRETECGILASCRMRISIKCLLVSGSKWTSPVVNGTVHVCYGGADRVIGLATCGLDELLEFARCG